MVIEQPARQGPYLEFMGEENEDLFRYSKEVLKNREIDFFIYGHRHLPMTYKLADGAEIIILGDWIKKGSFAEWDGTRLTLKTED